MTQKDVPLRYAATCDYSCYESGDWQCAGPDYTYFDQIKLFLPVGITKNDIFPENSQEADEGDMNILCD